MNRLVNKFRGSVSLHYTSKASAGFFAYIGNCHHDYTEMEDGGREGYLVFHMTPWLTYSEHFSHFFSSLEALSLFSIGI